MLQHPTVNSTVGKEIGADGLIKEYTIRGEHNFSIAIDSKDGLTVPNIKYIQEKSLLEINNELKELVKKTAEGKLTKADFEDATFSISSVGNIGGTGFVPTILPPQSAIMAIGKARKMPKYVEDPTKPEGFRWDASDVMNVSFSVDHRILDGATVLKWCQAYKGFLENPGSMLMNMR
jgi:2-oxoisovalerate dehydrogenase E2 component (dihydrolipoyl transacylase)